MRSFTCAHYNEEHVDRVVMLVCGCCVNALSCKNDGKDAQAKPALKRDEVDAAIKKPKLPLVQKTAAHEPKKLDSVTVDPKKEVKKTVFRSFFPPAPVAKKNVRPDTPRPIGIERIEEPKQNPAAAAAAENVEVEPKELPKLPLKIVYKAPSEPRPETPELVKMYKPLPDSSCTGITMKEVRQSVNMQEHNWNFKKWDKTNASAEQNKQQVVGDERG
jgi:hypothetical protein